MPLRSRHNPRWVRIPQITAASSMRAMIFISAPHRAHTSGSTSHTLRMSWRQVFEVSRGGT
jgi:hypothetical protein